MRRILKARSGAKGLLLGAVLGMGTMGFVLLGATAKDASPPQIQPQRFLVMESTPKRDPANGFQSLLLKVCPHYGKIDHDSLKFRLENESQELTMIVVINEGYEIRRGDIIAFEAFQHIRLSPGSSVTRHLPGGGHELVP